MPDNKYKSNKFSLVLIIPHQEPKFVNIPEIKHSYKNQKTSGTEKFLMAIDAYTTKFINKDELLDDIRKNGYATIKKINNDSITPYIVYTGEGFDNNDIKIAYKQNERLVDFINTNDISGNFIHFKDQYNSDTFNLIEDFKEDAYQRFNNYQYSSEYRKYLEKHQGFKSKSIYSSLKKGIHEDILERRGTYVFKDDLPFYEYFNIRKHLLTSYKDLEISFIEERYYNAPPNEKVEAYKDYLEELQETEEKYSPIRKTKFKDMKIDSYIKDPEEEMDELNNPPYSDDMNVTNNEKEFIADSKEYIYSNLEYEENGQSILPLDKTRRR